MRLKSAFRNLLRYRLNSSIIIISLAIGIACINLITLFISRELNADSFHENKSEIYALQADDPFRKGQKMYFIRYGAAEYMKDNFAEVEEYCRILNANPSKVTVNNQDFFDDKKTIATSSNFFTFFSYQLTAGSPEHALKTKQDVVISEKLALKYFGTLNAVGQKITFPNGDNEIDMTVSGVFKKPDESTQLDFEMVKLIGENDSRCYLLLSNNSNITQLEEKFVQNKETIPIVHDGTPGTHYLKSLNAAYFDTTRRQTVENSRDKTDMAVALIIALMILGVAVFNYLGLLNNRLMEKNREHSIRRVNGSSKINLVTGFLSETILLIGIAFAISLILIIWSVPLFNQLTASSISTTFIFSVNNLSLILAIPILVFIVSFVFTFFKIGKGVQPEALKPGKMNYTGKFNIPVFNIAQLAISIILIIGSTIILKQINYISNKEIGISKEVLEVKIPRQHKNLASVFSEELKMNSAIKMISLANASPVLEHFALLLNYNDNGVEKQYVAAVFVGDENYPKTLGVEIIEGEDFSANAASNQNKCIINESLAALFSDRNLIGNKVPGTEENIVIGICKDFHYGSLKEVIEPGYISYGEDGFYLMVTPEENQNAEARKAISETWNKLIPGFPLNMESIGDRFEWIHRENANYAKLIGACCIISVFLSMIGLFAVSFHTSRRRIKEIGIRKVNGANLIEILSMLNKEFIMWVVFSFLIATPISWFATNKWLENFVYRTSLSWWIFALTGVLALGIVLFTVSWQSWRTATKNPVEALRYE